jgi:hypothetical protein
MQPEIHNLEESLKAVGQVEQEFELALNNSADKEYAYEIAFSTAVLGSTGTNAETRKADAILKCQKELEAHLKAEARKAFMKSKMTDAQNAVSARQSILTNTTKTNFGQSFNDRNT